MMTRDDLLRLGLLAERAYQEGLIDVDTVRQIRMAVHPPQREPEYEYEDRLNFPGSIHEQPADDDEWGWSSIGEGMRRFNRERP